MGNANGPDYSEGNNARTSAKTMGDADGPEEVEGKIDITILDKTNMTPVLVSY